MKGNIVTLIFWGLFYLLDGGKTLIYIFVSASFHESAHIFFYYIFKARIKSVKVLPFGISAEFSSTSKLSFFKENIALAAGPLFNLIIAVLSFLISKNSFFAENGDFIAYNLAYFLLNILPVFPLDGGRVFRNILFCFFPYSKTVFISKAVSAAFILLLFTLSLVIFTLNCRNFSLLLISLYLLVSLFTKND